jgi:hypothetical protein
MGWALYLFCYKCKVYTEIYSPDLSGEFTDLLEDKNVELDNLIKRSEDRWDYWDGLCTIKPDNIDKIAEMVNVPFYIQFTG